MLRVSCRAGSIVIWNQRTAHGSAPNSSDRPRTQLQKHTYKLPTLPLLSGGLLKKGKYHIEVGRVASGQNIQLVVHTQRARTLTEFLLKSARIRHQKNVRILIVSKQI